MSNKKHVIEFVGSNSISESQNSSWESINIDGKPMGIYRKYKDFIKVQLTCILEDMEDSAFSKLSDAEAWISSVADLVDKHDVLRGMGKEPIPIVKNKISLARKTEYYQDDNIYLTIRSSSRKNPTPIPIRVIHRNLFLLLAGNKELIHKNAMMLVDEFFRRFEPGFKFSEITSVRVDLFSAVDTSDPDAEPVAYEESLEIWNFNIETTEIDWESYNPDEW